jgi:hypothetical protein
MIRKAGNPPSAQQRIAGAHHYFTCYNAQLVEAISGRLSGIKF